MSAPQSARLRHGRVSLSQHYYSITFAAHERTPLFTDLYLGRVLVSELKRLGEEARAKTVCFVIMPDHVHWFMQLLQGDLAPIVKQLKGRSARAINARRGQVGPVWQNGFHDHGVRNEESLRELSRYIVANPLRAKLVTKLSEYSLWDAIWLENRD